MPCNLFRDLASFALSFKKLDPGIVRGNIGHLHRPATTRFGTGYVFVLESLDKPPVRLPLLF